MGKKNRKSLDEWQEARRRCGLSDDDIRKARELGFRPRSLIKNIPSKSQPWKAPVRQWIQDLYAKRFATSRRHPPAPPAAPPLPPEYVPEDDTGIEELIPQYDTQTGEAFYTRESDDRFFTMDEAGPYFEATERAARRTTRKPGRSLFEVKKGQRRHGTMPVE